MQDNNQKDEKDTTVVPEVPSTNAVPEQEITPASADTAVTEQMTAEINTEGQVTPVSRTCSYWSVCKRYAWALLAIILIGVGLLFILEREGRVSTGIFSIFEQNRAVARVNGVKIIKGDYDSSLKQLQQMASAQGVNTTDPTVLEQLKTQAMDTLVNGELLRQAAQAANITAAIEAIDTRYEEVAASVGGADVLATRMAEFDITEKSLRRDIENEILIKELVATVIDPSAPTVTDEEVAAFYEQAKENMPEDADLPPLDEVKAKIIEQITLDRKNSKSSEFLEKQRETAAIEIIE